MSSLWDWFTLVLTCSQLSTIAKSLVTIIIYYIHTVCLRTIDKLIYTIVFALIETNQQIVKGLTHCLLPECSNPTWPFQNYCGRTHANIGIQRGLIRMSVSCVYPRSLSLTFPILLSLSLSAPLPSVDTSAPQQPKDSSLCIFPNCTRPKYVDGATTHSYCGRTHAEQGRKMGIVRKLQSLQDFHTLYKSLYYHIVCAEKICHWPCVHWAPTCPK